MSKIERNIDRYISQSYNYLREFNIRDAILVLNEALKIDFENQDVINSLKYFNFWEERGKTLSAIEENYKTDYLLEQWLIFQRYSKSIKYYNEVCLYAIRHYVFGMCLNFYKVSDNTDITKLNISIIPKIAKCYKGIGDYENAIKYFKYCIGKDKNEESNNYCQLADIYALTNEEQMAKLFFREAFFINPQKIEINFLESEIFLKLKKMVEDIMATDDEFLVKEWIPIYAVIFGVFTVKRELKSSDFGKLKQNIYLEEKEYMQSSPEDKKYIIPRLLNKYFWIIDYYVLMEEDKEKIEEILLKIQSIDNKIYYMYTR